MARTLDATLLAAQDSSCHHPIIEILSSQNNPDIPFDGQELFTEATSKNTPHVIIHSTGRLCGVARYASAVPQDYIRYFYSDTDRIETQFVDISAGSGNTINDLSLCELTNGNIGVIYKYTNGSTAYINYKILSVIGAVVSAGANIMSLATSSFLSSPAVIRLANDTYLLVYAKQVSTHYHLFKHTSSDFTTWAAVAELTITGMTDTLKKDSPHLTQIDTGEIWLWFDCLESTNSNGAELRNVYHSISSDNGATWSAVTKITAFTDYLACGKHPMVVQKDAQTQYLAYTEHSSVLLVPFATATGYCGASKTGVAYIHNISYDEETRKIYCNTDGDTAFRCVLEVDIDTFEITDCWNTTTLPGYPGGTGWGATMKFIHNESHWFVMYGADGNKKQLAVLDVELNTIAILSTKTETIGGYAFTENIDNRPSDADYGNGISYSHVDAANKKLWVVFGTLWNSGGAKNGNIAWGFFDLTDMAGPTYAFNLVATATHATSDYTYDHWAHINIEENVLVRSYSSDFRNYQVIDVYTLQGEGVGTRQFTFNNVTHDFPHSAFIGEKIYLNGKIYGNFPYNSGAQWANMRGLCEIDCNTGVFTYHRPTYATVDDYKFTSIQPMSDGRIILTATDHGIIIFNPADTSWTQYNSTTVPGMPTQSTKYFSMYEPTNNLILAGIGLPTGSALIGINPEGSFDQSHYKIGSLSGGVWSWGADAPLVASHADYDASILFDSDDSLWAYWERRISLSIGTILWDKESTNFPISDYLVRGEAVTTSRTIDGNPSSLDFTVAKGHLFDPHNTMSSFSIYLKKGRKLTYRLGEKVSGIDYWENQGSFIVRDLSLDYERGQYPIAKIKATDISDIWDEHNVVATDLYNSFPELVIPDVLQEHVNFDPADVILPTFDNRIQVSHQWLDSTVKTVITDLCHRFGYFPRIDMDGKLSARRISNANAVDHVYSNLTKILKFTPDDSFSDNTNRIVVTGFEQSFITVTYAEERIGELQGTVGWWGCKKDFTVYYSKDKSRTCVNPRLVVLVNAQSSLFSNVSESIISVDIDNKYCVIKVTAPNLVAVLVAAIATIIASYYIGDGTVSIGFGKTIPIGSLIRSIATVVALQVLATQGSFQYEVWGYPTGQIRRSVQSNPASSDCNDADLQNQLGFVVEKKYEDPLCYSVAQCQQVATQEMMIARSQRKRGSFSKIMHLQDEEGDTIQVPHPYTGVTMTMFITDIVRKVVLPGESQEGICTDDVTGWII